MLGRRNGFGGGWIMIATLVAFVSSSCPSQAGTSPAGSPIWDLTADLTADQWAANREIYEHLAPDTCDVENQFDARAHDLAIRGTPEALADLKALEFGGGRPRQVAAGRAYVFLAQQALGRGDFATAADFSLHIYLSSVPHRLRLEALRVYCRSASPEESLRWIGLIETGRQDPRFTPLLGELRASRLARVRLSPAQP